MTLKNFDEARELLLQAIEPLSEYELVPLAQAAGRVLAEDIHARFDAPAFDNSAMDGYAVAGLDAGSWAVVEYLSAGSATAHLSLKPGQAARIFTGAAVPAGAQAVVPQEQVSELSGEHVRFEPPPRAGQHIRRRAEEFSQADTLLSAGQRLSAAGISLAASQGLAALPCRRRLRVAVFSTGSELQPPGQALGPNQIYDSNRQMLLAALSTADCLVQDGGILPDELALIADRLQTATGDNDVVLISGGTSAGEKDYARVALQQAGQLEQWKLAIKPGKPFAWGRVNQARVFLLPGNPVAAWVTFLILVKPALEQMLGVSSCGRREPTVQAVSRFSLRGGQSRRQFLRGILRQDGATLYADIYEPVQQSSAMMRVCSCANALIIVPEQKSVSPGDVLEAIYLPDNFAGF